MLGISGEGAGGAKGGSERAQKRGEGLRRRKEEREAEKLRKGSS